MYKQLLFLTTIIYTLAACTKTKPNIVVVCEENKVGNCIIKWNTPSYIKGYVKVYASTSPEKIELDNPVGMAPITARKLVIIPNDPTKRYYYSMVFDNQYQIKVATRNINIPHAQNIRDIGGYKTTNGKNSTKWGMLYRSGKIDSIDLYPYLELKNIGVKTILNLRDENTTNFNSFNYVKIPFNTKNITNILKHIAKPNKKEICIEDYIDKIHHTLIDNFKVEYKQIFKVLIESDNYPIVIESQFGKQQTDFIIALILTALDIDENDIIYDYRLSNKYFDIRKTFKFAYNLPAKSQEAITKAFISQQETYYKTKKYIIKKYGSIDNYLKEIDVSKSDIKKIRGILLEKN